MSGDDRRTGDPGTGGRGGWLSIRVSIPERLRGSETRHRISAALVELGGTAVEETPGGLRTAVPASGGEKAVRDRLRRLLSSLAGDETPELDVEIRRVPARDWSREWRRGVAPRRLGRRLVVAPGWSDPEVGDHEVLLRVDPVGAFGSGEHGTTRGALRLLEQALESGDRVLDVGTGSGILALAAVKLDASRVVALDRDRAAVEMARHVLERNDAEAMREAAGDAGWSVEARDRDEGWWSALLRA